MTDDISQKDRIYLLAGGVAALAVVILGIFTKTAYQSVVAAALMWSAGSLSMIVLGVAFITVRRLFDTPVAFLAAALSFTKAILVVIPLFVVYRHAAGFMDFLYHFKNVVDVVFLGATAWVVFCGRKALGMYFSLPTTALLTLAALGLAANYIILYSSGSVPAFLKWTIILTTLPGFFGVGVGVIRLAVINPRG